MSGKCYKAKNTGNNTAKWESNWDMKHQDEVRDRESASDVQSQYSDASTVESRTVETPGVRERIRKLFESQSFTDVTFYDKNNRRMSISAHRAILAVSSPLFKKMLFDDQSKITVGEKLEVQISNLAFNAFTSIVKYIYTDEISFNDDATVQGILDGAKQFGIYSLTDKCEEYLAAIELTSENVCSKLQMSISNKIAVLKERCIDFIQENTRHVIKSSDFQKCNSTTVRTICKLQSLNLRKELDLLEAVMQWLHAQPYHERRSHLEPLLKCIRFLNFSVAEMGDALQKYSDLMTAEEKLSIMLFLTNPPPKTNFSSLPSWCNKTMQSRCVFKEDVYSSRMDLNVMDPNGKLVGKVIFPLKPDPGQGFVSELTSLLQMKCISGHHEIKAIKLSFDKPLSGQCRINSLFIKVHVNPSGFRTTKKVMIISSESLRVEFSKAIKVHQGDILDVEAQAKSIEHYKFLQFDEVCSMPANPHFDVCISSSPKIGKLYLISEVEYGPQERPKFPPKGQKDRNRKK